MPVWFVIVKSSGFGILCYANLLWLLSIYLLLCTLWGKKCGEQVYFIKLQKEKCNTSDHSKFVTIFQ